VADSLLNLQQAADYLGSKPSGLRKVVKRGGIRYVQVGQGPIKFRREWLDEFVTNVNAPPAKNPQSRAPTAQHIENTHGFNPDLLNI
jgi:excisionase family DNA binding protein